MRKLFGEGRMPLRAEVVGAAVWEFIVRPLGVWLLLGAGAVLSATARYVENLTEFEQGALYVVSAVLLLLALAVSIVLFRRQGRVRPAAAAVAPDTSGVVASALVTAPAPSAPIALPGPSSPSEPLASAESIERLREVYSPWGQCIRLALNFLDVDICRTPAQWTGDQGKNGAIATLLLQYPIPNLHSENADFNHKLTTAEDLTRTEFQSLVKHLKNLVNFRYVGIARYVVSFGGSIVGPEKLLRAERYAHLYKCHQEAIEELRRVRDRLDIGHVAESLNELARLLPEPTRRNSDDHLIEDPQELARMMAWEGKAIVMGRKWFGELIIKSTATPSVYGPKWLTLHCSLMDNQPGQVDAHIFFPNKEELLVPQKTTVFVEGTIKELSGEVAVLWPAKIVTVGRSYE